MSAAGVYSKSHSFLSGPDNDVGKVVSDVINKVSYVLIIYRIYMYHEIYVTKFFANFCNFYSVAKIEVVKFCSSITMWCMRFASYLFREILELQICEHFV